MYECFHCGSKSVVWSGNFSFEDYGLEGEGIIQCCYCSVCNADIEYKIPLPMIIEEKKNEECK